MSASSGIWETTDGGASWTQRTGNLGVTDIHTVTYAKQAAVDVVLVGGHGGVARMISSTPGTWTSYGTLPGADVYDLDYNAATDVLAAATLGRGAWTVSHASATLAVNFVPGHTDNRYWFTVEGTGLGGSLNLGPVASATLSGVSISFNTFGGQYDADPASVLDWQHSVDLNTGAATFGADPVVVDIPGDSPITLDLTSGGLHLAGNLTDLSIAAGLITGHSGFSITLDTVDADLNGDNTIDAAAGDVNNGSLFTLSLTGLHLNIGTSGFGVSITGGEVDIAALTPATPTGPATDTRQWIGIRLCTQRVADARDDRVGQRQRSGHSRQQGVGHVRSRRDRDVEHRCLAAQLVGRRHRRVRVVLGNGCGRRHAGQQRSAPRRG